ncbi:MAG: hypothetical protein PUI24_00320 [Spirochaetales bacterium]|nr:hypothetical protein [Spirochaetia bacterium]MDD7013413.1 hypothetical protein [Spirochaetales bacterium]
MNCGKSVRQFCSIFFLAAAFISCSGESGQVFEESSTLRLKTEKINSSVNWTDALEGDKLTEKVSDAPGFASKVKVSSSNIFFSGKEKEYNPVYPYIEGFTSLDLSGFEESALSAADSFCSKLIAKEDCSSFMKAGCSYQLTVFLYNCSSFEKDHEFKSCVLGSPCSGETLVQVPVRFYFKDAEKEKMNFKTENHCDIYIYLEKVKNEWKVTQLDFIDLVLGKEEK